MVLVKFRDRLLQWGMSRRRSVLLFPLFHHSRLNVPLCFLLLLLQIEQSELETGHLVLARCPLLLNSEQPLDEISLGLLEVALAGTLAITVEVNARGLRRNGGLAFAPLLPSTVLVGDAVFAVVGMCFLIPKNPGFFDTTALRIYFRRTNTDGVQRDDLLVSQQTINRRFDQLDRPLSPGFVIFL
jgi:hypothetical protein